MNIALMIYKLSELFDCTKCPSQSYVVMMKERDKVVIIVGHLIMIMF